MDQEKEGTVTQRSPAPDWFRRVGTVPQLHFDKNRSVAHLLPFTFLRHVGPSTFLFILILHAMIAAFFRGC